MMGYKLNIFWMIWDGTTLLLKNHLQGSVKIITLRNKRFLLVWQVISASYCTPQYLLNKIRSRHDWHTREIRFYQNVSNRSNFLRNIFYFCTFMGKMKRYLQSRELYVSYNPPPPIPPPSHTHTYPHEESNQFKHLARYWYSESFHANWCKVPDAPS